jgi:hypothetical protein
MSMPTLAASRSGRPRLVERVAGLGHARGGEHRDVAAADVEHRDVEGTAAHVEHDHPQWTVHGGVL